MKRKGQDGFTLIEVMVVAGIIAVLAGILVPIIFKEIDESRKVRALADIQSISTAIIVFRKDVGAWPVTMPNCVTDVSLLFGDGALDDAKMGFTAMGFDSTAKLNLSVPFAHPAGCYAEWKGPYMAAVPPDPWGNAYIINAAAFYGAGGVWILSAGPNGVVETNIADSAVVNDDIGDKIR